MLPRHAISDADWDRIQHLLPGQRGQHGGIARDNRLFLDAVLYVARTGIPWEDRPARFGNCNSPWRRCDRWAQAGRWAVILAALRDEDLEWLILDSTAVRAHPCAAGAKKNGTAAAARRTRPWAVRGADSGPRSTAALTRWGTRSS
jgi:transposase